MPDSGIMTGYRRVNYYELCRLCTSNDGVKLPIFKDEGRARQLSSKIQVCLRLQVSESDSLPKYICSVCLDKLECCFEFRTNCASAEVMLQSYANALKNNVDFQREGMVYIKEEVKVDEEDDQEVRVGGEEEVVRSEAAIAITTAGEEQHNSQHPGLPMHLDSFASLVEAATIQIIPDIHDQEVLAQDGEQEVIDGNHHTITLPAGMSHHDVVLLQCDPKKGGQVETPATIVGSIKAEDDDDDDERTTIHMEEFLKLKCGDINKNHGSNHSGTEETFNVIFAQEQKSVVPSVTNSEDAKSFQCPICSKTFKRKEHVYQHKKLHTGERPFKCQHCVRTFSRKEHLVRHAHSHTGQKLFSCDICGKSFSRKDNVSKHRKTHDAPTSVNNRSPCVCEFCGIHFTIRPYYMMHKNKHKDGSCVHANKEQLIEEEEGAIAYEEAIAKVDSSDVQSSENDFQQVTSSTSSPLLEKALKHEA